MNRPTMRLAAAALGGLAVVTVIVAIAIAALEGSGSIPGGAGWVVPLVAGGSVGLLSWFLLSGSSDGAGIETPRPSVRCSSCGTEVREEWRLCPYCGGINESPTPCEDADVVAIELGRATSDASQFNL